MKNEIANLLLETADILNEDAYTRKAPAIIERLKGEMKQLIEKEKTVTPGSPDEKYIIKRQMQIAKQLEAFQVEVPAYIKYPNQKMISEPDRYKQTAADEFNDQYIKGAKYYGPDYEHLKGGRVLRDGEPHSKFPANYGLHDRINRATKEVNANKKQSTK